MENMQLKEYSNAAQIDAAKIPQPTIDILADIIYDIIMLKFGAEADCLEGTAS